MSTAARSAGQDVSPPLPATAGPVVVGIDGSPAAGVAFEEASRRGCALVTVRSFYVPVQRRLVRGPTRQALIEATEQAQLAVVGSRSRGGFTDLLLGSVSQAVLHHATCPVAIVHHAPGRS